MVLTLPVPRRLDSVAVAALHEALLDALTDARVVVLRGEIDFCLGLDLGIRDPDLAALRRYVSLLLRLRGAPRPTLAVVTGSALGGGLGLAAACDVVIAAPDARFGLPEALSGLVPGMVGPIVAERIGAAALRRLAIGTTSISAEEALRIGLIDRIAPDPVAVARAEARGLGRAAPDAVGWLKQVPAGLREAVEAGAAETAARILRPEVRAALEALNAGEAPWTAA
jgi:enoyl-CoA hydratase/carnithine racemase